MARKAKFQGFVPYSVGKEVKTAVKDCKLTEADVIQSLILECEDGYKFALAYEDEREAYSASLYQNDSRGANSGLYLAARHADASKALTLLYVLHNTIFAKSWPDPNNQADQYNW